AEGVVLNWKTESEVDHLGFIIERRLAGALEDSWEKIASYETHQDLMSQGNQSSQRNYEFIDVNVELGQIYIYRISDIDIEGQRGQEVVLQVQHTMVIPTELALHQNYPNPFNPATTIQFALPEKQHVQLNVYNLAGQKVETLINEEMGIGEHQAIWNASQYSAGLYFSELIVGDQRLVKKMHLIK
ncbi:T9SS type A sorting domain-containing protein, partial [bacterium]